VAAVAPRLAEREPAGIRWSAGECRARPARLCVRGTRSPRGRNRSPATGRRSALSQPPITIARRTRFGAV